MYKGTDERAGAEGASAACPPREMSHKHFDVLYNALVPLGLSR